MSLLPGNGALLLDHSKDCDVEAPEAKDSISEEETRYGRSWSSSQIRALWPHNPVSNLIFCHNNFHLTSLLSLQYIVFFSSDLEFEDIRNIFFFSYSGKNDIQ